MMVLAGKVSPRCSRIGANRMTNGIPRFVFLRPLIFGAAAFADDSGTPDEAKAMAVRAGDIQLSGQISCGGFHVASDMRGGPRIAFS